MKTMINPCLICTRIPDPENCENKKCVAWQAWFLSRWAQLHSYPRRQMDRPRERAGVVIGGIRYAHPEQVRDYLRRDPCKSCACGAQACVTPCRPRQNWAKLSREVQP